MTNGQSRTAIAIMPPLFIFAVTSEQKLTHRMHEVAEVNEHNIQVCLVFVIILSAICYCCCRCFTVQKVRNYFCTVYTI